MKKIVSAAVVFAIVGSALAFKTYSEATVYCNSACPDNSKILFKVDPQQLSPITDPCETGSAYFKNSSGTCVQYQAGTRFIEAAL